MIDAYADRPHYRAHIEPVWEALPPQRRGVFHTGSIHLGPGAPVLVSSYSDYRRVKPRPVIYMEHGAGQTYLSPTPSYAGGPHKERVALFLSPSERVAALNRATYPHAAHAVIGCPLIDPYIGHKTMNLEPVVALAWHRDGLGEEPEARNAFRHYRDVLPSLPWKLLGHGHPREMRKLRPFYVEHGIEVVEDFAEVLERADVLAFDNTSAGYMFAATGRPVVVMNAPWYRRDVHHGLRFWEFADVGLQVDEPDQLAPTIQRALIGSHRQAQRRREVTEALYGEQDGKAAQRAAAAVALLDTVNSAAA